MSRRAAPGASSLRMREPAPFAHECSDIMFSLIPGGVRRASHRAIAARPDAWSRR